MTRERNFFSGDTLEQAVLRAARHFQIDPGEVAYRELEKRHGFLRTRRRVVIEVDSEQPSRPREAEGEVQPEQTTPPMEAAAEQPSRPREAEGEVQPEQTTPPMEAAAEQPAEEPGDARSPDPAPSEEAAETFDADSHDPQPTEVSAPPKRPHRRRPAPWQEDPEAAPRLIEGAEEALDLLLDFADLEVEFEIETGEDRLEIELDGDDEDLVLADRGRLLLAIQHLLPRVMRGAIGESTACRVDCADFHADREEHLQELAERVAGEVRRQYRPRSLPPLPPEERRVIHLALVDDPEVVTESQGEGFFKRITVSPARRRPRGF